MFSKEALLYVLGRERLIKVAASAALPSVSPGKVPKAPADKTVAPTPTVRGALKKEKGSFSGVDVNPDAISTTGKGIKPLSTATTSIPSTK